MIPGEYILGHGEIVALEGRRTAEGERGGAPDTPEARKVLDSVEWRGS